jgi:hypothetical protein
VGRHRRTGEPRTSHSRSQLGTAFEKCFLVKTQKLSEFIAGRKGNFSPNSLFERNWRIYALWLRGRTLSDLATQFDISSGRVGSICDRMERVLTGGIRRAAQNRKKELERSLDCKFNKYPENEEK